MNLVKSIRYDGKIDILEVTERKWCTTIKFLINESKEYSIVFDIDMVSLVEEFGKLTECDIIESTVTLRNDHRYRIINGDDIMRVQKIHRNESYRHFEFVGYPYEDYTGTLGHFQPEDDVWQSMYYFKFDTNTIIEDFTNEEKETRAFVESYKKAYSDNKTK